MKLLSNIIIIIEEQNIEHYSQHVYDFLFPAFPGRHIILSLHVDVGCLWFATQTVQFSFTQGPRLKGGKCTQHQGLDRKETTDQHVKPE